jgi:hypothetical protein
MRWKWVNPLFLWAIFNSKLLVYWRVMWIFLDYIFHLSNVQVFTQKPDQLSWYSIIKL